MKMAHILEASVAHPYQKSGKLHPGVETHSEIATLIPKVNVYSMQRTKHRIMVTW